MEYQFANKVVKIYLIWTLIWAVIFGSFYFLLDESLVLGFLIGAALAYVIFNLKQMTLNWVLNQKKFRFKLSSRFLLIFFINMLIIATILYLLLWINLNSLNNPYKETIYRLTLYPSNIFTFTFGLLSWNLAILIASFIKKTKERSFNDTVNRTY
ncbi:hypothetical protein [Mycoplasmopsis gallinarum]|uniref:hypothetical protein n=1 Tax=Mycoplasmopsis gallinarum TaxID=29557 RepID=UPI00047FAF89|nr:hypothetical protein [Mycoplasmopsis gallinarum]